MFDFSDYSVDLARRVSADKPRVAASDLNAPMLKIAQDVQRGGLSET